MKSDYLDNVKKQLEHYKMLGEKTFVQLPDEKLYWKYNENSNSVAAIVKHLSGNMLSRWTSFLSINGVTEWKDRETEFDNEIKSREELLDKWNKGWSCLLDAINSLTDLDLPKTVYIRNQLHTVTEAINMQLAHYSYHVGQIVFIGKMVCNHTWTSLSIPESDSQKINGEIFLKPEHKEHSVEDFLREKRDKFIKTD